jgi:thiol-disulfide isomerase/thioredoxin|tara:strand:- start:569 stop:1171 length:603 start_codon:yes stop_codon:yes gene_type:complete
MNKNIVIGISALFVIGLAVAIGVTLSSEPVAVALPEGEVVITGDVLPPYSGENDDNIAFGLKAPLFSGPDQYSNIVSLEKDGNAKALIFLAHWCPHCQREVPAVQEYIDTMGVPDGIDIIAIATSIDKGRENYPPTEWLAREGWTELQIYDIDKKIGDAYGLNAFPYWVFLDKELKIIARRTGNLPQDLVGQLLISLANQ